MSDLHERIGDEVMRVLDDGVTGDEVATRILAMIREALLSPEALRALKYAYEHRRARNMACKWEAPEYARTSSEAFAARPEVCGMTAALAAAGIGEEEMSDEWRERAHHAGTPGAGAHGPEADSNAGPKGQGDE